MIRKMKKESALSIYLQRKFRNGIEYDWPSAQTETDRSFRFKSYQAVCFSSYKTCQLSTSYSPTRSLWLVLSPTGEKRETSEEEEAWGTREVGMRDAKVCAMRKFVANFTRLRSEAEERWNRARPVLWVVPFYFRHKNSLRRRFAANYSPLDKEGGREEGRELLDGTRNVCEQQQSACTFSLYVFHADNYGSELTFNGLR